MKKKFELTDETKVVSGMTLHRICALEDFADVKKGDLGGWIEKKENLSQEGNCWIDDNAWVCGKARVYGDAWVYGNAQVYGNARVYGKAWVCGDARVYGNAEIRGHAVISFCFVLRTGSFGGPEDKNDLFMRCPQKGSFTAFKKVVGKDWPLILEIEVPADAKRSSAHGNKCRCSKAKAIALYNPDGTPSKETKAHSKKNDGFVYEIGKVAVPDAFDENRWEECSNGIHFFMSFEEARDYED